MAAVSVRSIYTSDPDHGVSKGDIATRKAHEALEASQANMSASERRLHTTWEEELNLTERQKRTGRILMIGTWIICGGGLAYQIFREPVSKKAWEW